MPVSTVKVVFVLTGPPNIVPKMQAASRKLTELLKKTARPFSAGKKLFGLCALIILATFTTLNAQTLNARISVVSPVPARIKVDVHLPNAMSRLSFRNIYGGVVGLGERIETVEGVRDNGEKLQLQKLAPGEFRSTEQLVRFSYEVNLSEPQRPADLAHVSSLNSDHGVLMMADLLPQPAEGGKSFAPAVIKVDVPRGWTVASNTKNEGALFSTDDPDTAIFLIAPSLNEKRQRFETTNFSIVMSGKWPFSDGDATKIAGNILEEYSRVTGFALKRSVMLMLIPYPGDAGPESWSAETRGNVVVLLLGKQAKRKSVLARLGIVLSHELFHLWVPNSLEFAGDYDWFFEGFTLYQALRTDLRLRLISFGDYLQTLAGVYDSYRSRTDRDRLSLIDASQSRWTTSGSLVYEKGMLVAFIYDLSLRKLTDCRASFDDLYPELFRLAATGQQSANETIISVLSEREGLKTFSRDYIENVVKIDLEAILPAYGIQVGASESGATHLILSRSLTKAQENLLGCVGHQK